MTRIEFGCGLGKVDSIEAGFAVYIRILALAHEGANGTSGNGDINDLRHRHNSACVAGGLLKHRVPAHCGDGK